MSPEESKDRTLTQKISVVHDKEFREYFALQGADMEKAMASHRRSFLILRNMNRILEDIFVDSWDSIFAAIMIGAWTAFETLATDLWVESLNRRPDSLGLNAVKAPRRRSQDEEPPPGNQEEKDSVSYGLMRRYKGATGSMLKDIRKFGFNKLSDIRHAYSAAFGAPAREWFSGNAHDEIVQLEAIRNLFVHRAGKIDRQFLERVKNNQRFANMKDGDLLLSDGVMVKQAINAASSFSGKLLLTVDDWLTKNPN